GSQAVAAAGKSVRLSTVNDGKTQRTFTGPAADVTAAALSPSGSLVAAGTADAELFVWQAKDGALLSRAAAHGGALTGVASRPASSQLLTAGRAGAVKLWAAPPAAPRAFAHPDAVRAAVSPDGKRIVTGGADKVVRVWDAGNPKMPERQLTGHTAAVGAVALSADGSTVVSGGDDHFLRVWDRSKGTQTRLLGAHAGSITSLAFHPANPPH